MYRLFIISFVLLFLSGCSLFGRGVDLSHLSCPDIGLLKKAEKKVFKDASGAELASIELNNYNGGCSFKGKDKKIVEIDLNLFFLASVIGDAKKDEMNFDYFVAILSPNGDILNKQVFSTSIGFDGESKTGVLSEESILKIPLKDFRDAKNYKVVFGIQP